MCHEVREAYEGVSVPGFPNLFVVLGPYGYNGSSYFTLIENQTRHILRVLRRARKQGATVVEVRAEANERYQAALQSYIFEGQAFWNRISVFVLLNSALLVARNALPAGPADRWTRAGIALLGLVSTVLWAHTALRAHYQGLQTRSLAQALPPPRL